MFYIFPCRLYVHFHLLSICVWYIKSWQKSVSSPLISQVDLEKKKNLAKSYFVSDHRLHEEKAGQ